MISHGILSSFLQISLVMLNISALITFIPAVFNDTAERVAVWKNKNLSLIRVVKLSSAQIKKKGNIWEIFILLNYRPLRNIRKRGIWVFQLVKHLASAKVMISGSWD